MIDKSTIDFILDGTTWSYSRINCYVHCPHNFYLHYIENMAPNVNNAFAEWGSFCHSIFERYFKGEIDLYSMADVYETEYEAQVTIKFPSNKYKDLSESYYQNGLDFFRTFEGIPEYYEIIGVEMAYEHQIRGRNYKGVIDLLVRDKRDNRLVIVDHKSHAAFKNEAEEADYRRQLYLYAAYVYDKYGEFPKELVFNMFRAREITRFPFIQSEYIATLDWAEDTIRSIYNDKSFTDRVVRQYKAKRKKLSEYKYADFFCANLCGSRFLCKRSKLKRKAP